MVNQSICIEHAHTHTHNHITDPGYAGLAEGIEDIYMDKEIVKKLNIFDN